MYRTKEIGKRSHTNDVHSFKIKKELQARTGKGRKKCLLDYDFRRDFLKLK